jgi:uncharacterized protein (DUF433 family)
VPYIERVSVDVIIDALDGLGFTVEELAEKALV